MAHRRNRRAKTKTAGRATGVVLIMAIYFCSGACSLIDEVVWARLLKLTLGNTVYASSIVVSVFMAGLALGALIMGRFADRVRHRLRLYAMLELCATVAAVLMPAALRMADSLYRWYFITANPSPGTLLGLQVAISTLLLLAPTMLMGSTLPLLGRFVTDMEDRVGHMVGRLYAINMLGAALGCFLAGFVLIQLVGVMGALYAAAGLNVFVAAGGWWLSRSHDTPAKAVEPAPAALAALTPARTPKRAYVLMAAFFASGLISIGLELIWMRSIVVPLGGFTYVFSAVLTVYLLGNVIGAGIGSRLARRLRNPAVAFGVSLGLLAITAIFYIPWFRWWFVLLQKAPGVRDAFAGAVAQESLRKGLLPIIHSLALFMLPSIAMGVGFPLALQAWAHVRHSVGRTTGVVYGVNTLGAVVGGLVTGFVLIPMLGVQRSTLVLGLAGLWLGGLMIRVFYTGPAGLLRTGAPAAVVLASLAAVYVPADLFRRTLADTYGGEILEVREGASATVAVVRHPDGALGMAIDNIEMAGDGIHRSAQQTLGHLPVLLHGNAKQVLSFGFGCGETTRCLAQHGLEQLDCVEIAPEVTQMALKYFRHINLGDALASRVRMIHMDGKNYLHLTDRRYDVIINDSNVHSTADSAPLFTREHFRTALEHLNSGGLFITKIHLRGYPQSHLHSILGTFMEVFPHVTVWFPVHRPFVFCYLVGSREPQLFSPARIDAELAKHDVRTCIEYLHLASSQEVLSWYIGDKNDFARYIGDYVVNSDRRPFIEFNLDADRMEMPDYFPQMIETVRRGSVRGHIEWAGLSAEQRKSWEQQFAVEEYVASLVLKAHGEAEWTNKLVYAHLGLRQIADHRALLDMQADCITAVQRAIAAGAVAGDAVLGHVDGLLAKFPDMGAAWLIRSLILRGRNDLSGAAQAGAKAVELMPFSPDARVNMGVMLAYVGKLEQSVEYLSKALGLDAEHPQAHYALAIALGDLNRMAEAVEHYEKAVARRPDVDTSAGLHRLLAGHYLQQNDSSKARASADRALALARASGNDALAAQIQQWIDQNLK